MPSALLVCVRALSLLLLLTQSLLASACAREQVTVSGQRQ